VLGKGRQLFPAGVVPKKFEHVESRHTAAGVTVLVLRRPGTRSSTRSGSWPINGWTILLPSKT
jgi:hypothetical protein